MTDNEFNRTARAWLEDGPTLISDRALQSALDEVHRTRQRPAWLPARRPRMFTPLRLAAAAVAIMLTVVGVNLLSGGGVGGLFGPTPTPSPTPIVMREGEPAPLDPGTYVTADPFRVRVTFTVPAEWQGNMGGPNAVFLSAPSKGDEVIFSLFEKVYSDPCHFEQGFLDPLPGPSTNDLATALTNLPGLQATTPADVTVAGYQGKQLTLTAPASFADCTQAEEGNFRLWELPLGAIYSMSEGQRDRVWILDVDGQRLVIQALEKVGQTADQRAQVDEILDSIRLAPGNPPTSSPS